LRVDEEYSLPAALSLAPLYLLGLGLLAATPLHGVLANTPGSHDPGQRCATLAGLLSIGILGSYLLVLLLGSLPSALAVGGLLAVAGLGSGLRAIIRSRTTTPPASDASTAWLWLFALLVAVIVYLYAVLILTLPLTHWDARSIWFFQAKIIYFSGALANDAAWTTLEFMHGAYPKLLPTLAAQVADVAGFWNETLPKSALLVLLCPAAIGLTSFVRGPLSGSFLIAMLFFPTYGVLWNGYADGYLALYAGLSVLALGRWVEGRCPGDLLLGFAALGISASLKNEGLLFLLCVAVGSAVAALAARPTASAESRPRIAGLGPNAWIFACSLAAPLVWGITRRAWGLTNDLDLSPRTLTAAAGRLGESGALASIMNSLFRTFELSGAIVPVVLSLVFATLLRVRIPAAFWLTLVTATLYLAGIFAVYLGTPHELGWHLETSADRTVLPIFVIFSVAAFQLLDAVERPRTRAKSGGAK
jgi:hypothetical protein